MTDAELDRLNVQELRVLIDRIDLAIRAAIRAKRLATAGEEARPEKVSEKVMNLEQERDAWLSAKRSA
mgnify:CR=1 FL=1